MAYQSFQKPNAVKDGALPTQDNADTFTEWWLTQRLLLPVKIEDKDNLR
jgi:hypothetical protein